MQIGNGEVGTVGYLSEMLFLVMYGDLSNIGLVYNEVSTRRFKLENTFLSGSKTDIARTLFIIDIVHRNMIFICIVDRFCFTDMAYLLGF